MHMNTYENKKSTGTNEILDVTNKNNINNISNINTTSQTLYNKNFHNDKHFLLK